MFGALILFLLFIFAYITIVEIFTVLFRLTGMTEDKARFQVISMLTTIGYTTSESEFITMSVRRRRLATITILFGYSFNVIIVSIVVNVFIALSSAQIEHLAASAGFLVLGIGVLLLLIRATKVKVHLDTYVEKIAHRWMYGKASNPMILMDSFGDRVIMSVHLNHLDEKLARVALKDLQLKHNYGLQIILITRGDSQAQVVDGDSYIQKGDVIVVFGTFKSIKELFG